jgi:hypothetical protein
LLKSKYSIEIELSVNLPMKRFMMRLLDVKSRKVTEFSDGSVPAYATLSHTWGSEEISLEEMKELQQNPSQHATRLALKEGFQKIEGCCRQASQEGLDWIWVDTCCIDKTSSSETSEAISSMFNWYRDSRVCYVYLADVTDGECLEDKDSTFRRSRWFTRGWTLQELLAPTDLLFFSKSWTFLEKRQTLCNIIEEITRIPSGFLGRKRLSEASIAQRMSWAANSYNQERRCSLLSSRDL